MIPPLKSKYWVVDCWVIFNLLFSLVSVYFLTYFDEPIAIGYSVLIYGLLRVFEIFVYQINVLLFHPYKNGLGYTIHSYRRMIIALLHNFFEIILWFAVSYIIFKIDFGTEFETMNPFSVIYFSLLTMVSYSSAVVSDGWSISAIMILQFQAIVGVFMTLVSLARFISLFPKPLELKSESTDLEIYNKVIELEKKIDRLSRHFNNQRKKY
jgi:hypothetical protein